MHTFAEHRISNVGRPAVVLDPVSLPPPTAVPFDHALGWRKLALAASLVAAPALAGLAYARATTRRRGLVAGGLTALAIGALRVELARWFTPEPAFRIDGKAHGLELRRCAARIEVCTDVHDLSLDTALDHGYSRLASYVCGGNLTGEVLPRTMPVLTAMRGGHYTVSLVMPEGRAVSDLPRPEHSGIELREVPAHTIAVLRFRGRFTSENVAAHERMLLQYLVDAGLSTRGSATFAAFDSPLTLPILRRNEIWIETV